MSELVYNQSKQSDKNKLTDKELDDLAKAKFNDETATGMAIREIWKDGFRTSETKHVKEVWKLRKVIKGYIHALGTMYREND